MPFSLSRQRCKTSAQRGAHCSPLITCFTRSDTKSAPAWLSAHVAGSHSPAPCLIRASRTTTPDNSRRLNGPLPRTGTPALIASSLLYRFSSTSKGIGGILSSADEPALYQKLYHPIGSSGCPRST